MESHTGKSLFRHVANPTIMQPQDLYQSLQLAQITYLKDSPKKGFANTKVVADQTQEVPMKNILKHYYGAYLPA
jgi:hypothetical protein